MCGRAERKDNMPVACAVGLCLHASCALHFLTVGPRPPKRPDDGINWKLFDEPASSCSGNCCRFRSPAVPLCHLCRCLWGYGWCCGLLCGSITQFRVWGRGLHKATASQRDGHLLQLMHKCGCISAGPGLTEVLAWGRKREQMGQQHGNAAYLQGFALLLCFTAAHHHSTHRSSTNRINRLDAK